MTGGTQPAVLRAAYHLGRASILAGRNGLGAGISLALTDCME